MKHKSWHSVPGPREHLDPQSPATAHPLGGPTMIRRGTTDTPVPLIPKVPLLGLVKTFPELPGTEPGPTTRCSLCPMSSLSPNPLNTKQRGFCLFFPSPFSWSLSPFPSYCMPFCPLSYTFPSTPPPILALYPDKVLPCSKKTTSFPIAPVLHKTMISVIADS